MRNVRRINFSLVVIIFVTYFLVIHLIMDDNFVAIVQLGLILEISRVIFDIIIVHDIPVVPLLSEFDLIIISGVTAEEI